MVQVIRLGVTDLQKAVGLTVGSIGLAISSYSIVASIQHPILLLSLAVFSYGFSKYKIRFPNQMYFSLNVVLIVYSFLMYGPALATAAVCVLALTYKRKISVYWKFYEFG